jgi:phosphohistidine phosphatase
MKGLILLRHAKSSWKEPTLDDFDRPLNKRGRENVPLMGQRLAAKGECPDVILSSPAKRARSTAHLVALELYLSKKQSVLSLIFIRPIRKSCLKSFSI